MGTNQPPTSRHPIGLLCNHLFGEEHTHAHRILTGIVVIFIGTFVAHQVGRVESEVAKLSIDGAGYAIHGIGLVPIIEYLIKL